MWRRSLLVVAFAAGAVLLTNVAPRVSAQQEAISIVLASAVTDFPWSVTFQMNARSTGPISRATLRFSFDDENETAVVDVPVRPLQEVMAQHRLDLRRANRPPELGGRFRWTVWDSSGNSADTGWQTFRLEDNRFRWKQVSSPHVTVLWHQGSDQFGRDLLAAADAALVRLHQEIGVSLSRPSRIIVYERQQDMLEVLSRQSNELTGGVTYPLFGIIVINIPNNNLEFGRRAIPHELTHLLVQERLKGALVPVPAWLNEGLASFAEGPADEREEQFLRSAYQRGALLRLWDITPSFPRDREAEIVLLAYAQSRSVVTYILERYGREKLLEMLDAFKRDAGHAEAVRSVLGVEMDQLDADWREWLAKKWGPSRVPAKPASSSSGQNVRASSEAESFPVGLPLWLMALVGASALVGSAIVFLRLLRALRS